MGLPKQAIIIGNGSSRLEGEKLGLKERIKNKLIIGLNANYRWFDNTFLCWCDSKSFYAHEHNNLSSLPLVVGRLHPELEKGYWTEETWILDGEECHPNLYFTKFPELKCYGSWHLAQKSNEWLKLKQDLIDQQRLILKEPKKFIPKYPENHIVFQSSPHYSHDLMKGVYTSKLTGVFALTIAAYLMNWEGEIFLLGYDACSNPITKKTHAFSQKELDYTYRGLKQEPDWFTAQTKEKGKVVDWLFEPYLKETKLKIYNVSTISKIPQFEKISYEEFFQKLHNNIYSQDQLRTVIKKKLLPNSIQL